MNANTIIATIVRINDMEIGIVKIKMTKSQINDAKIPNLNTALTVEAELKKVTDAII